MKCSYSRNLFHNRWNALGTFFYHRNLFQIFTYVLFLIFFKNLVILGQFLLLFFFPLPSVVSGYPAELRLLEPSGGDERLRRHGGLQDAEEGWIQLQRAGPGRRRLVHVPAPCWRLPAYTLRGDRPGAGSRNPDPCSPWSRRPWELRADTGCDIPQPVNTRPARNGRGRQSTVEVRKGTEVHLLHIIFILFNLFLFNCDFVFISVRSTGSFIALSSLALRTGFKIFTEPHWSLCIFSLSCRTYGMSFLWFKKKKIRFKHIFTYANFYLSFFFSDLLCSSCCVLTVNRLIDSWNLDPNVQDEMRLFLFAFSLI